jgi:glycosyltransferase involved in cell wall biosynthesis
MRVERNENTQCSITFLLPGRGIKPSGGFKVVYEYANRLSLLGFKVSIVHIAWLYKTNHIYTIFKGALKYIVGLFTPLILKKWFLLNKTVKSKWIFAPFSFLIPNSNFIIATAWETSEYVSQYPDSKGKKLYLIQGNESEFQNVIDKNYQNRVIDTWKFPINKIVISSWLEELLQAKGVNSFKLFNGLDFNDFFMFKLPEERSSNIVMMLYHTAKNKGTEDGLNALCLLKKKVAKLRVILYGVNPKPKGIEEWFEYFQLPATENLRTLYNTASIFLSPSHSEGWGLPIAEAMQCGCCIVTTNIGGTKDFVDNSVSLQCEVGNINELCDKLYQLIIDDKLRIKLAYKGNTSIKKFTWERSVNGFVDILDKIDIVSTNVY